MKTTQNLLNYFSRGEKHLWLSSIAVITFFFLAFDRTEYLNFISSLIGVTSLIFCAKGNPIGMIIMVIFSIFYGIISYTFAYYGEMITYLGMTMPMSIIALISWLKNPYEAKRSEVKVNRISRGEILFMFILSVLVTLMFYYILKALNTANLLPSTFSVFTSFVAAYLTFRRSPFFALAYATNDIVLIILWSMASLEDISYISVTVCFAVFLINDLYGFINWLRMQKKQKA